jgi:hypothetical protein
VNRERASHHNLPISRLPSGATVLRQTPIDPFKQIS